MAFTPKKSVQFAGDDEVKEFVYGSPYSEGSSMDSNTSSSTLQYINSQLIAHGFARGSGVSFDGLSGQDADRLSKCMLAMLGQRADDLSRVENATTKLRTLSYENERIAGMQRTTAEQLAASERDTNLYKSKLNATVKALQASETAHKATSAEMSRTRTAMQSLRQTHVAEIKRKEKEVEKMLDRWQKLSDTQAKLGSSSSGMKFNLTLANPTSSLRDDGPIRRGPDLLEDALEAAEISRKELSEEITSLKNVVLSTANELARILRACRMRATGIQEEEVPPFEQSEFFALSAPENASERMGELLGQFRQTIIGYGVNYEPESTTPMEAPPKSNEQVGRKSEAMENHSHGKEVQRLQNTIVDLRRQLEQAQTRSETGSYANQAQEIVRKFVNNADDKANVHERQLLEKIRKELDHARKKVDEAALALRDEKAALEEDREKFTREQQLWRSQMCIPHNDDVPKPLTGLDAYFDAPAEPLELPHSPSKPRSKRPKSPKKAVASPRRPPGQHSPARPAFAVGRGAKKSSRAGSTPKKPSVTLLGASTSHPRVIPPMETEVMAAPKVPPTSASNLIVPNSFVLPPPSPLASLPRPEATILSSLPPIPAPFFTKPSHDDEGAAYNGDGQEGPSLSPRKPFPIAKPLAQHMIHAYSPARPSPLSRILRLSNSPTANLSGADLGTNLGAGASSGLSTSAMKHTPLAEELRVEELISVSDDSPLKGKGKKNAPSTKSSSGKGTATKSTTKPAERRVSGEKPKLATKPISRSTNKPAVQRIVSATTTKPMLGGGKGGARRVPIGSADAAPMGPAWK